MSGLMNNLDVVDLAIKPGPIIFLKIVFIRMEDNVNINLFS